MRWILSGQKPQQPKFPLRTGQNGRKYELVAILVANPVRIPRPEGQREVYHLLFEAGTGCAVLTYETTATDEEISLVASLVSIRGFGGGPERCVYSGR